MFPTFYCTIKKNYRYCYHYHHHQAKFIWGAPPMSHLAPQILYNQFSNKAWVEVPGEGGQMRKGNEMTASSPLLVFLNPGVQKNVSKKPQNA